MTLFQKLYSNQVVQSCVLGEHKPDHLIYQRCLQELHVKGDQAIFLDDLGVNLKAAQEFGIKTIKVSETERSFFQCSWLQKYC